MPLRSLTCARVFLFSLALTAGEALAEPAATEGRLVSGKEIRRAFSPALTDLRPMYLDLTARVTQPEGQVAYCHLYLEDCLPRDDPSVTVPLTLERLQQLTRINEEVNLSTFYKSDIDTYNLGDWWEYPYNGIGDCEDIVLEKRARLIDLGWPAAALLITLVVTPLSPDGEIDHAVLTVSTEQGDLVLDMHGPVLRWQHSAHRFVARQSPFNPIVWQKIIDERTHRPEVVILAERW